MKTKTLTPDKKYSNLKEWHLWLGYAVVVLLIIAFHLWITK